MKLSRTGSHDGSRTLLEEYEPVRALHFPLSHSFPHKNLKSPCAEQLGISQSLSMPDLASVSLLDAEGGDSSDDEGSGGPKLVRTVSLTEISAESGLLVRLASTFSLATHFIIQI